MTHRLAVFIFILAISSVSHAQLAAVREEIVVTASSVPETVETTPASVSVITREDIDDRAARDIADVLREVPGITISRTGSAGRATSLFTRGSNSTHTLVMWNGLEITNPYFSGYDWGRFSTVGVEQVEVVRGPYSALYGSDAVAGVVNILTAPKKSELRAGVEAGGNGLRNGQVVGSLVSANTVFSASLESREDDGWDANDDFAQKSANVLFRWTAGSFTLGLTARHTDYDLGIPFNLSAAGDAIVASPLRRQDGTERQVAIPLSQTFGRFSYEVTLAESRREDHFEDPEDAFGFVDSQTDSVTRRARLETKVGTAIGTIVIGGEYERAVVDDVNTYGVNLDQNRRVERSFFIEDRYSKQIGDASRLELSAGLRHDRYDTFGSETSPRVAAAFIAGGHKIRGAFGEAFRAPSIGELYFPFSGNVALRPETSRSAEIGYDRSFGGDATFSLTLFTADYKNLIVFDNATYAFGNIGAATSRGAELSAERRFAPGLSSGFSYTYLDTEQGSNGETLLRRPRHSGSVHAAYRTGNIETNVIVLHTGARADVLPVAPFSRASADAYTTLDVNVQYDLGRLVPYVKIENLTNERYEEVLGYTSPQRRTLFGVRYSM